MLPGYLALAEPVAKNKMAEQKLQAYEIERPEPAIVPPTRMTVPYQDSTISFAHPFSGPNTYREVGKNILEAKNVRLSIPTGGQTAHLLHATYCGPEEFKEQPEAVESRKIMKGNYFWVFNRNLWTSEGVYVVTDPEAVGLSQALNQGELENSLEGAETLNNGVRFNEDRTLAFAPKESYKLGGHTPESFAQDGFVIANFGEAGAEKLGEVSKKFRYNPRTWGLDIEEGRESIERISAVDDFNGRFDLRGDFLGDDRAGYASGVFL